MENKEYNDLDELRLIANEAGIENPQSKNEKRLVSELEKKEIKAVKAGSVPPELPSEKGENTDNLPDNKEENEFEVLRKKHEELLKQASKKRDELNELQKEINILSGELNRYKEKKDSFTNLLHARQIACKNTREMSDRQRQERYMRELNNRNRQIEQAKKNAKN